MVSRTCPLTFVLSLVLQPFFQNLNDEIGEYYTEADMLTPSIYIPPNMTTDAALRKQFILATVREAVRIRENIKNKTVSSIVYSQCTSCHRMCLRCLQMEPDWLKVRSRSDLTRLACCTTCCSYVGAVQACHCASMVRCFRNARTRLPLPLQRHGQSDRPLPQGVWLRWRCTLPKGLPVPTWLPQE
jgi:hypothetical protein